jgi:lysophospholipase L1-like esterase
VTTPLIKKVLLGVCFAALLSVATVALLELVLRFFPMLLPEPTRSIVRQAARTELCNTRMYNGTSILLPQVRHADIVAVGDSFTFGSYVRETDTFPAQLGKKLGRSVANLGIASTGPPEYNRMAEVATCYSPELLLYCVFANDFETGPMAVEPLLSVAKNRKQLPGDEKLFQRADAGWMQRQRMRKQLTNLSLLLQLMKLRHQPVFKNLDQVPARCNGHFFAFAGTNYWNPQVSWETPAVRAATESNVSLIKQVKALADACHFSLLVVLVPSKEMVYGPLLHDPRFFCQAQHQTYDELTARLQKEGVACFDLTEQLAAAARTGESLYLAIDGHLDESGHSRVAQILADYISVHPVLFTAGKTE